MEVYLIELDPNKTFSHHIEIIKSYFPNIKIYNNYTLIATPYIEMNYLPVRFEPIDSTNLKSPCDDLLGFVNGDENDVFVLYNLVKKHGWHKVVFIS